MNLHAGLKFGTGGPLVAGCAWASLCLTGAFWALSPRSFVAEDSYFYLVAARRLALEGNQSFSGVFPSNGFHPLWLYLLAAYSWIVGRVDVDLLWRAGYALPLSLSCVAAAAYLFGRTERELDLPSGALVLPSLLFVGVLGILYSEGHVLLLMLAWLAHVIVRISRHDDVPGWKVGLAIGLTVLARLDMIFLALAAIGWYARVAPTRRSAISAAGVAGGLVGAYVLANVLIFGGAVPISGWLKSSFPVPTPTGFRGSGVALSLSDYAFAYGVVPVVFAVATAFWYSIRRRCQPVLAVFAAGSAAHMAYTMLFASWCGWSWYYVLSVVTGCLAVSLVLRSLGPLGRRVATVEAVLLTLLTFTGLLHKVTYDNRSEPMKLIQARLASPGLAGKAVFVSELPGEGAFLGHAKVIAADMLTANRTLYEAIATATDPWGALTEECARRGSPISEIIYIGGAFVKWDGADGLVWLDPKVSSRRPLGRIPTGARRVWRPAIPFAAWSAPGQ